MEKMARDYLAKEAGWEVINDLRVRHTTGILENKNYWWKIVAGLPVEVWSHPTEENKKDGVYLEERELEEMDLE